MKFNKKKGFTVVELVIVIAVIAIMAAVLIPTFTSLVRKANESADIQAVRQMNTYLAVNEITADKTILEVYKALSDGGMKAENYRPLVADRYFYWDSNSNRIIYTDADNKVLFPEGIAAMPTAGLYSLTQEIKTEDYTKATDSGNITVEISSAGQLVKLAQDYEADSAMKNQKLVIKIKNDIDMMGASFHLDGNNIELIADSQVTITGLVNTNKEMTNNNSGKPTAYYNTVINAESGNAKISIKNITFKNMALGNADSSDVALIKLTANGGGNVIRNEANITLENVHIVDSDFTGKYRIAGFLAHVDAEAVTMTNCSIKDSRLTASVGAVAPIFSMLNNTGNFKDVTSENNTIVCTNTNSRHFDSLEVTYGGNKTHEVKLPADGTMVLEDGKNRRWYPAKSSFGIYGTTISFNGGTVNADGELPLASGGLDCVETMKDANNYKFNAYRIS